MMQPCRGLALVKRVEVENKIGSLYAPDDVVDKWTAQQVEVVALGEPALHEEIPDRLFNKVWNKGTWGGREYYFRSVPHKVGDWLLIQPRVLCPTDTPGLYMIAYSNILGVFSEQPH